MTSSTAAGSTSDLAMAAATASPPSSTARNGFKAPPYLPIGVLAIPVITELFTTPRWYRRQGDSNQCRTYARGVQLLNLDHVAIAVHDLEAVIGAYRDRYHVEPLYREVVESQGVEEAMIPVGGSFIQLLMPLGDETPVGRFLSKSGEGLHHVAYAVSDIESALAHLKAQGARLVDDQPRVGGRGSKIAFVHPADVGGTLIELVELGE